MGRIYRRIFRSGDVDCEETRRLGSDYLENGLSPKKRSLVQTHLDKCGPCRSFVDTLASTIGMLQSFPRANPPPSFKQSILERAKKDHREER